MESTPRALVVAALCAFTLLPPALHANGNVHVTRFWHNHQPVYWPEWMGDGGEPDRGQLAWDSIQKKPFQNYGGLSPRNNPENDLEQIFGLDDRRNAYQGGPSSSLGTFSGGGFAMSYSGALIDNVRQLAGANQLGYGSGWNNGNTSRRQEGRLDLVGFTHHHSLGPLLPKEVFRKEIQIFKQAWWKAWGGNSDLSDHSKGFFPTEMAYTRDLIDVLVDEGFEWVIVASHHISRTSPSYNDRANPEGSYNIYSSPPNRADQLSPRFDNPSQWWYGEPNPGNAAWNVAPFAYQLHKVQYVNPNTGAVKEMVAVPSDDVLSYRFGYAAEGIGKIADHISPHATDPNRPVIVMPSSDGDNAWGGGSSSWFEATPQFFNESANAGYVKSMPGTFVNQFKQHAPVTHIEDGAWVFPEMCYGSPNFLKWIEPPLYNPAIGATNRYPGTQADMETPGYALKFFSYAPLMAGANWVITAEQILRDQGGEVRPWVVHAPYGVSGGEFSDRNDVELAWHIYLRGLDSGFNYYGGLGNDDEVKPSLATKRAVDRLRSFMSTRMNEDRTGPTALKPQRFPYNPGGFTFGWFNRIPGGDERFLKKMPSYFYIWTHVYDVSGVASVNLKIRRDKDGQRSLLNTHNETYAGGGDVEDWITVPMTKRVLPKTRVELNAAASNGEIDFFVYDEAFQPGTGIEVADYYFAKIDDSLIPGFRDNLFDYYVESTDTRGNVSRSEIQHVFVEDDGETPSSSAQFSANPNDCEPITVTYAATNGPLEGASPVFVQLSFDGGISWDLQEMSSSAANVWTYTLYAPDNAPSVIVWFQNAGGSIVDSRNSSNWTATIRDCEAPTGAVWTVPFTPVAGQQVTINYNPEGRPLASASSVNIHHGYNSDNWTTVPGVPMTKVGDLWTFTYTVPAEAISIMMVFNNGASTWDNNGGNDWILQVSDQPPATEPPPVPTGLSVSSVSGTSITLAWNAANTASGYKVFRNGQQVGTPSGTTFTDTGLQPETSYSYQVAASNGAGDSVQAAVVSGTTSYAPVDSDGLRITAPTAGTTVPAEQGTLTFTGVAGSLFTNGLAWSNALTGSNGTVAYSGTGSTDGWQWTALVGLGTGLNSVQFAGAYAISETRTANDSPVNAAYNTEWATGSNGGTGFGAWSLTSSGSGGHFIAQDPENMSLDLARGFGLWAHDGGVSRATRAFLAPMSAGDVFTVRMDNNWITENGASYVGIAMADDNGTERLRFYFVGGQNSYSVNDTRSNHSTGIAYTGEGLDVTFELTGTDTYRLTAGSAPAITGTLASGGPVSRLVAINNNAGEGAGHDFFVGAMTLTSQVDEAGAATATAAGVTRGHGDAGGFPGWSGSVEMTEELLRGYAVGGAADPSEAGTPMVLEQDQGDLVMTVIVRTDDPRLGVTAEATVDLGGAWSGQGVTMAEHTDQDEVPEGCMRMEVRVPMENGRRFLRLKITYTP